MKIMQRLLYIFLLPILLLTTAGTLRLVLAYIHAFGLACILILGSSTPGKKGMYKLRNVMFNLELPPKTLWFNMGLWDEPDLMYPEACVKLVQKVVDAMQLKPKTKVLDVGYGCGDSCFWLADQYKCDVTGITNEAEQWKISRARLTEDGAYRQLQDRVCLIQGSATDLSRALDGSKEYRKPDAFDHIVCIDSAYHYSTRWDFLRAAQSRLVPGGTMGLYDLAMTDTGRDRTLLKYMLQLLLGIPIANMVTVDEYKVHLESMGFRDIQIERLDRNLVFGGLSRAIQRQYETAAIWDTLPPGANRAFMKTTAWLFGLVNEKDWLTPVIVRATCK